MKNGISMELGGLDGSPKTRSMTYDLERLFGWKRIIIDGNPMYREPMKKNSPDSFSAIAAICETHTTVHYATSEYVGGILEFMGKQFMKVHINRTFCTSICVHRYMTTYVYSLY